MTEKSPRLPLQVAQWRVLWSLASSWCFSSFSEDAHELALRVQRSIRSIPSSSFPRHSIHHRPPRIRPHLTTCRPPSSPTSRRCMHSRPRSNTTSKGMDIYLHPRSCQRGHLQRIDSSLNPSSLPYPHQRHSLHHHPQCQSLPSPHIRPWPRAQAKRPAPPKPPPKPTPFPSRPPRPSTPPRRWCPGSVGRSGTTRCRPRRN